MLLTLKFIGAMRQISGKNQLIVNIQDGNTLRELIEQIGKNTPELPKIFGGQKFGNSNSNSLVLVNGREISVLNGLDTKLMNGDEIVLIPVVHGG
jgi:molybdopterin synthase sulfur carrier subunit